MIARRAGIIGIAVAALLGSASCASAPQPTPVVDVLALGDSVPAGSACGCVPFPALYARLLSPGGHSVDLARSGYTSGDVRTQVDDPATGPALRAASVVVVMVGANDLATVFAAGGDTAPATAALETNMTAILHRIRAVAAVPVLVLGYWNVVEDGDVARADYSAADLARSAAITQETNNSLRTAAAGLATYVPTLAVFEGPDGAANPTALLAPDGDHPDARGHQAIAAALYAVCATPLC